MLMDQGDEQIVGTVQKKLCEREKQWWGGSVFLSSLLIFFSPFHLNLHHTPLSECLEQAAKWADTPVSVKN